MTTDLAATIDAGWEQRAELGLTTAGDIRAAVESYCREVREGAFPAAEHSFR